MSLSLYSCLCCFCNFSILSLLNHWSLAHADPPDDLVGGRVGSVRLAHDGPRARHTGPVAYRIRDHRRRSPAGALFYASFTLTIIAVAYI